MCAPAIATSVWAITRTAGPSTATLARWVNPCAPDSRRQDKAELIHRRSGAGGSVDEVELATAAWAHCDSALSVTPCVDQTARVGDRASAAAEDHTDPCQDVIEDGVDRSRDLVRGMTSDVFAEGRAVDLAPRPSRPTRKAVHLVEQVVRHGHSRLHTPSVTVARIMGLRGWTGVAAPGPSRPRASARVRPDRRR